MFMAISRIRTLLSQFGFLCHCLPSTPLCINTCSLPSGFIVITRPQYLPHSHPSPTFQIFPGTAFIYFYWCGRVMAGESSRRSRNNPVTRSNPFSAHFYCVLILTCSQKHPSLVHSHPGFEDSSQSKPTLSISEQDMTDGTNLFDQWGYKTKKKNHWLTI